MSLNEAYDILTDKMKSMMANGDMTEEELYGILFKITSDALKGMDRHTKEEFLHYLDVGIEYHPMFDCEGGVN